MKPERCGLAALAMASLLPGCSTMGTATVGPVFSVSSSGVGYGWSASGGVSSLDFKSRNGPALTFGIGQSWRHAENVARPAAPGTPGEGRSIEMLTYFDFGLRGYFVESFPSYAQFGIAFGPVWSSLSEDPRAGLVADFAPAVAFVPGQYTWFNCSTNSVNAPTFVAMIGWRWLYGSWEIYASPQVGFVSEQFSPPVCSCHY